MSPQNRVPPREHSSPPHAGKISRITSIFIEKDELAEPRLPVDIPPDRDDSCAVLLFDAEDWTVFLEDEEFCRTLDV